MPPDASDFPGGIPAIPDVCVYRVQNEASMEPRIIIHVTISHVMYKGGSRIFGRGWVGQDFWKGGGGAWKEWGEPASFFCIFTFLVGELKGGGGMRARPPLDPCLMYIK